MSQRIVSNQTQGTMKQRYHDSLLDIFLALGIFFATAAISAGLFWLAGILPFVISLVWVSARQSVTAPRRGGSVAESAQSSPRRLMFTLFSILGLVAFVLGVVMLWMFTSDNTPMGWREWVSQNFVLVGWVFGGLLLGMIALLGRLPRYYFYALLALAAGTGGSSLGFQPVLYVLSLAGLMLVIGLINLLGFLRTRPR